MNQPPPMQDHHMRVLIKRFFAHKDQGSRQTELLRNLATRAYLIGYEQAKQDLESKND